MRLQRSSRTERAAAQVLALTSSPESMTFLLDWVAAVAVSHSAVVIVHKDKKRTGGSSTTAAVVVHIANDKDVQPMVVVLPSTVVAIC